MDWLRLQSMIRKEFRQMGRNPVLLRVLLIAPIFQLIMFGYAATTDVEHVPVVICDQSNSRESRAITGAIGASRFFNLIGFVEDYRDLKTVLDAGDAQLALHIPVDFDRRLRRNEAASVGLYIDGTDAITANTAASYMVGMLQSFGREVALQRMTRAGMAGGVPGVEMVPRVWYNPDLRSANFMVPGVFGLIIMMITAVWTSQSIVKERELGTLEQLLVTPVRPIELLVGQSFPYAVTALVVPGTAGGKRGAAVWRRRGLHCGEPRDGDADLHRLAHAAAGSAGRVLLHDAGGAALGLHVPDREHAVDHPAGDVADPLPLLPRSLPRHLPARRGT